MVLTEQLISGMVKEITGGYKIKYHPHSEGEDAEPVCTANTICLYSIWHRTKA